MGEREREEEKKTKIEIHLIYISLKYVWNLIKNHLIYCVYNGSCEMKMKIPMNTCVSPQYFP